MTKEHCKTESAGGESSRSRHSRMVEVGSYGTRSDAEFGLASLAGAGIESVLEADDAGGAYPFVLSGAARLLVAEPDAAAAALLLSDRSDKTRKEQS